MTERERIELCEALDRCDDQVYNYVRELEAERDQLRLALQEAQTQRDNANASYSAQQNVTFKLRQQLQESQQRVIELEEELADTKETANFEGGLSQKRFNQLQEQQTALQELAEALKIAKCPDCDGSGAYLIGTHDPDLVQCGWCSQQQEALAHAAPWLRKEV